MKKIFSFIKKVIISFFVIYGYNLILSPLNLTIPINVVTVLVLSIFGPISLLAFVAILLLIY